MVAELQAVVQADKEREINLDNQIREWEAKRDVAKASLEELAKRKREATLMCQLADDSNSDGMAAGMQSGDREAIRRIRKPRPSRPIGTSLLSR
jgi:hypothetical protein